jgi:hypothetical protein
MLTRWKARFRAFLCRHRGHHISPLTMLYTAGEYWGWCVRCSRPVKLSEPWSPPPVFTSPPGSA